MEFANEVFTPEGVAVNKDATKAVRAEARAEAAERYRRGRRR
jgi:hypothetical protein